MKTTINQLLRIKRLKNYDFLNLELYPKDVVTLSLIG
jgi:hypothetical protein